MSNKHLFIIGAIIFIIGCNSGSKESHKLPILSGVEEVKRKEVNGEYIFEEVYQTLPSFQFVNQDGDSVTEKHFKGKVFVTDFFFTSCPTICPTMSANMLKLYEHFEENPHVLFLSHSIDPRHDSVHVLSRYAHKLEVTSDKWHFITGVKDEIFDIASFYEMKVEEDSAVPGGIIHSGNFILVDQQGRIRGYYNGTSEEGVEKLKRDIPLLVSENIKHE